MVAFNLFGFVFRELAFQIADQFRALGKSINLNDTVVVGGLDMSKQAQQLSEKPHVVIATPGRLAGHLNSGNLFSLKNIKFLVLDEADRLLEKSFEKDIEVTMIMFIIYIYIHT